MLWKQYFYKTFRVHNAWGDPTVLRYQLIRGRGYQVKGTERVKGFANMRNLHTGKVDTVGLQNVLDWIHDGSLREES